MANKNHKEIPMAMQRGPGRMGGFGGRRSMGPVVKPKNFKDTLLRLWKYFKEEQKLLIIIFIFIIISS